MSMHFQRPEKNQHVLQCTDHSNETITNYCSAVDCLKPLCPECMFNHNMMHKQKHTYPEIESLRGVIMNSQKRLKEASIQFQKEVQSIENQMHEPQIYHQESTQHLQKMKKQIINLVELHFQELEHKLAQSTSDLKKKFMHLVPQVEKLKQFQKEIELMFKQLDPHDSQLFQTLQRVQLMDVEQFLDKFKNDFMKNVSTLSFEQLILSSDDTTPRLGQLKIEIEKCIPVITYRHHPYPTHLNNPIKQQINTKITTQQSYVENLNTSQLNQLNNTAMLNQSQNGYSRFRDDTFHDSPQSLHDSFQGIDSSTIKKKDIIPKPGSHIKLDPHNQSHTIVINQPDYFQKTAPRKFLHFFQNDSNNLFFMDLSQLNGRQVLEFQLIQINNNFVVPSFHRSLAAPNGNLYLIGGTLTDGQKSGITYQFDFQTNSLQAISMMLYPRSSHGVIHLNGYIYAIGGYEQKHIMSSRCERMSTKGKWETISSLNQVCTSMSVCTFGKDFIYKFGGITANYNGQYISNVIERYDTNLNVWKIIDAHYTQQIQNLSTSACCQINSTDIIVFGGYNEDNIGSNQCYILSQQDEREFVIHSVNHKPLPFSEAFWNSQVILQDLQLFVLQNVSGESEDSCLEDERLLLCFNGKDWKVME